MIQALNMPYSSKRDEIMSRYRPIAPKPELSNNNNNGVGDCSIVEGILVPEKFRQSPYLRSMWSQLQARPTRTRKRGRTAGISPAAAAAMLRKHQEHGGAAGTGFVGFSTSTNLPSHASNLSFHAFGKYGSGDRHATNHTYNLSDNNFGNNIVELPLLPSPLLSEERRAKAIDLNTNTIDEMSVFEEQDLSLKLEIPSSTSTTKVISPRPVRPVGSTISIVGPISEDTEARPIIKSAENVEEEVEFEELPAVITDRGNKVRMVNSAYMELVGQPECPWLDSMISSRSGRRISGEVMIQFPGFGLPVTSNGFNSWVRIEWECDGRRKYVNAFCEVTRLACESKDYVLYWRFHAREVSPSGSKV